MAYVNTSYFKDEKMECAPESSDYLSPTKPGEDDVSYCTINCDGDNETIGLSSVKLEPSNTELLKNTTNPHTHVKEYDGTNKYTEQPLTESTCQKSKLKLSMVIVGMFVLFAASLTIAVVLLKQVRVLIIFV